MRKGPKLRPKVKQCELRDMWLAKVIAITALLCAMSYPRACIYAHVTSPCHFLDQFCCSRSGCRNESSRQQPHI